VVRDKWGMEEDCIGSQGMQQKVVLEKKLQKKKKKRYLSPRIYTYLRIHFNKLKKKNLILSLVLIQSSLLHYKSKIFIPNITCGSQ